MTPQETILDIMASHAGRLDNESLDVAVRKAGLDPVMDIKPLEVAGYISYLLSEDLYVLTEQGAAACWPMAG